MSWRILLLPLSLVYALVTAVRNMFYNTGIFRQHQFKTPVILVGNLSVGGTGKTPHIEYLIRLLSEKFSIATLSRGYGRNSSGFLLAEEGVTANEIGDEPMLYFVKNKNVKVSVCEKRVDGIQKLQSMEPAPDIILMDDGFQHRSVSPGLSILLTSYHKLFCNDFVLPAGDLREPRSGYKRANCIVVTKVPEGISDNEKENIQLAIDPQPGQQLFFSSFVYGDLQSFASTGNIQTDKLKSFHVVLFTGIADVEPLLKFVGSKALSLTSLKYPDHYEFTQKEVNKIANVFHKLPAEKTIILTTEKDYLRLFKTSEFEELKKLPCYFIPVTVKIDNRKEFDDMIFEYIQKEKTKLEH